jgi:hypothetical protein
VLKLPKVKDVSMTNKSFDFFLLALGRLPIVFPVVDRYLGRKI